MAEKTGKAATPGRPQEFFRGARLMAATDEPDIPATFTEVTDDPRKRLYLQALAQGVRYGTAARAAGVCAKTAYNWRADAGDRAFQEAMEVAVRLGIERAEGEFYRRGFDGVEKPVYQGGRLVGTVREFDTTAGIVWLKAHLPDKYRENLRHEHGGIGGGPVQVQTFADVSDEQLFARLDQLRSALAARLPPALDVAPVASTQTPEAADYAAELAKRNGNSGNGHG